MGKHTLKLTEKAMKAKTKVLLMKSIRFNIMPEASLKKGIFSTTF
jgi:hypothetical protein